MDEKQYRLICETCDSVLNTNLTKERVAIDWLHVLNEHPVHLLKYSSLFDDSFLLGALRRLKSNVLALLQVSHCIKSQPKWYSSKEIPNKADVVIISHLISESQAGLEEDFYFGHLAEFLESKGLTTVVILRDHTAGNLKALSKKWPLKMAPRLFFSKSLSCKEEYLLRRRQKQEASLLKHEAKQCGDDIKKRVLNRATVLADSWSPIAALRFYSQIETIVERLRPKTILVTYEGHAWERLVFSAARKKIPDIHCIGYQHAILFPRQHAIKRSLGCEFNPDVILTGGDVTRNILRQSVSLNGTEVRTIGTHRQDAPSLSLTEKLHNINVASCLVIPDGNLFECLLIIRFSITAAKMAPNVHFIIRLHPLISFEDIVRADNKLEDLPTNIELSACTINEDFTRCRWALYRGSGAAIRAVVDGLRPFYITLPNELNIDPLYALTDWRCIISTANEFVLQAESDIISDNSDLEEQSLIARRYCQNYFKPVDLDKFYEEVKNNLH